MLDRAVGEALLARLDDLAAELARSRAELVAAMPGRAAESNGLDPSDDFQEHLLIDPASAQARLGIA